MLNISIHSDYSCFVIYISVMYIRDGKTETIYEFER